MLRVTRDKRPARKRVDYVDGNTETVEGLLNFRRGSQSELYMYMRVQENIEVIHRGGHQFRVTPEVPDTTIPTNRTAPLMAPGQALRS